MGKSITTKKVLPQKKEKTLKAKKTAASIKKTHKDTKSDVDELKQLLNLTPPTINLNMFDKMEIEKPNSEKRKKLSVK